MLNEHPALGQVASYLISKVSKERTTARQLIPENHQGGAEMIDMDGIDPGVCIIVALFQNHNNIYHCMIVSLV